MMFIQDRVVKEQVSVLVRDQVAFDVVPYESGRNLVLTQVAVEKIVGIFFGMVGEVGQGVIDLRGEQKLSAIQRVILYPIFLEIY